MGDTTLSPLREQAGYSLAEIAALADIPRAASRASEPEHAQSLAHILDRAVQFLHALLFQISHRSLTGDEAHSHRKFGAGFAQGLAGLPLGGAVYLEYHAARTHVKDVPCDIAFPATHSHFGRFLCVGPVWKDARPDLGALPARARERAASRLYLIGCHARLCRRFQAVCAEGHRDAARVRRVQALALPPSGLPFAVFCFFWCQHNESGSRD